MGDLTDKLKDVFIGKDRGNDDLAEKELRQPRVREPRKPRGGIQRLSRITAAAVGVAVVSLLFGCYMTFTASSKLQSAEGQMTKAVVATSEIAAGEEVTTGDVALKELPSAAVPSNAATDVASVVGKTASSYIASGAAITPASLNGEQSATAAGRIGDGKVAISITVSQQTGVAGLVHQGDFVSVLSAGDGQDASATVLAQHVRVLALDAAVDGYNPEYTALTLIVEPQEAQRIATAVKNGQVSAVLESYETAE